MLLVIQRTAGGPVTNAFPIADDDVRAAAFSETVGTEVYAMDASGRNVTLTRQRLKAGTAVTRVVTTGGVIEIDPR